MHVGVLKLMFHLPSARSLKDKRHSVRRFKDRVRGRFDVAVAEVGALDRVQRAVFGVAVVSNDQTVCDKVLAAVADAASKDEEMVLTGRSTEILPMGEMDDDLFSGSDGH